MTAVELVAAVLHEEYFPETGAAADSDSCVLCRQRAERVCEALERIEMPPLEGGVWVWLSEPEAKGTRYAVRARRGPDTFGLLMGKVEAKLRSVLGARL